MRASKQIKKSVMSCAIALASLAILTGATGSIAETTALPDPVTINTQSLITELEGMPKDKKSVNSFTHAKHATTYLIGNSKYTKPYSDDFTCLACHPGTTSPEQIAATPPAARLTAALEINGGPKKLKKYFHGICLTCHKAMKKENKATGPTSCKGCHKRQ